MSTTSILAITSYFKGEEFLRACKREGAHVMLLTEEQLKDEPWPRESIDEVFLMPNLSKLSDVVNGVAYLARHLSLAALEREVVGERLQARGLTMRDGPVRLRVKVAPLLGLVELGPDGDGRLIPPEPAHDIRGP